MFCHLQFSFCCAGFIDSKQGDAAQDEKRLPESRKAQLLSESRRKSLLSFADRLEICAGGIGLLHFWLSFGLCLGRL